MRTLTVGFSKSTKKFAPFSWLLKAWDRVPYSHVYFKFENNRNPDIPLIYQASSTMLNFMSVDVFKLHSEVVEEVELQVSDELYNDILRDCMKCSGMPYGLLQVFGTAIAEILNLNRNPLPGKKNEFVCSEWVARQMTKLGYRFHKSLDLVKPIDVYEALKTQLKETDII